MSQTSPAGKLTAAGLLKLKFEDALEACAELRGYINSTDEPEEVKEEFREHWGPEAPDELKAVLEEILDSSDPDRTPRSVEGLLRLNFDEALKACQPLQRYIDENEDPESLRQEFRDHWHGDAPTELRDVLNELLHLGNEGQGQTVWHQEEEDEDEDTRHKEQGPAMLQYLGGRSEMAEDPTGAPLALHLGYPETLPLTLEDSPSLGSGSPQVSASNSDSDAVHLHLPSLEQFRSLWQGFALKENREDKLAPDVKLVIGIFTYHDLPHSDEVRAVIKQTWMNRTGVCWLGQGPSADCSVYAAFVVGWRPFPKHSKEEIVLKVVENMNHGKTLAWLQYASSTYPWATHIAKLDLDAYPYLGRLTWSLQEHMHMGSACEHYVGTPRDHQACQWLAGHHLEALCPPDGCGKPVDGNFLRFARNDSGCWSWMNGGLYVLSAGLARGVSQHAGMWEKPRWGPEDIVTGQLVSSYGWSARVCIDTWEPLAWEHMRTSEDLNHSVTEAW